MPLELNEHFALQYSEGDEVLDVMDDVDGRGEGRVF